MMWILFNCIYFFIVPHYKHLNTNIIQYSMFYCIYNMMIELFICGKMDLMGGFKSKLVEHQKMSNIHEFFHNRAHFFNENHINFLREIYEIHFKASTVPIYKIQVLFFRYDDT